jgi:hypothetical protein
MDRNRLSQIKTTDITESRVNEALVTWLRTSGPTYLLAVLVMLIAYLFYVRYTQGKVDARDQAWIDLIDTDHPDSLQDVATEHDGIFAVPHIARLQAAARYMTAVQGGKPIDIDPTNTSQLLSAEQRDQYLRLADGLYDQVLSADDGSMRMALHAAQALDGKAAVAECRVQLDEARSWHEKAANRVRDSYPELATRLDSRATTTSDLMAALSLPTASALPKAQATPPQRQQASVMEGLRKLVLPNAPSSQMPSMPSMPNLMQLPQRPTMPGTPR